MAGENVDWVYGGLQLFNAALCLGWPLFSLLTVGHLRRRPLPAVAQALWVLIVVAVPYIGALAYWLVRPSARETPSS